MHGRMQLDCHDLGCGAWPRITDPARLTPVRLLANDDDGLMPCAGVTVPQRALGTLVSLLLQGRRSKMEGRCCEIGEVCGWVERLVVGAFLEGPSISTPDSMSSASALSSR